MSNTQLLIKPTGELVQNGATGLTVQFLASSDETGSILYMFNKFNACFTFDNKRTVTVNLAFSGAESQAIDIKEIGPELFNKVDIYVDLIDDTTSDGDLYDHLATNTVTLEFNGKTLADYGIVDAYTKDEVNAKIPTKVSQLQNDAGYLTQHQDISGKADKAYVDELVGGIEDQLSEV